MCIEATDRRTISAVLADESRPVERTLFDSAVATVKTMLRRDPYVRFLDSAEYTELRKQTSIDDLE